MYFILLCFLSTSALSQTGTVSLSHGNGGMALMPTWTTFMGENFFSFCLPDLSSSRNKRKIGRVLCRLAGYRQSKFIGKKDEYDEFRKKEGLQPHEYYTDKSCLPRFGVVGLNCGGKKSKNLQRLEDCKPKFSWTHPMGCITGRDEIFLHCAKKKVGESVASPKLISSGSNEPEAKGPRASGWSEWKATESVCDAENQYKQFSRECITGTGSCSGPWFKVEACPSCGKPDENMANADYNEDYYDDSYYSSVYSDYPDSELETITDMPKDYVLNETDLSSDFTYYDYASNKRKKRETEDCKCQIFSGEGDPPKNKRKKEKRKNRKRKDPSSRRRKGLQTCQIDYSNWRSDDGSSCQEIFQERKKDREHIEGYNQCPQSNKCVFNKTYIRGKCDTFSIDYDEGATFGIAGEFNDRLKDTPWWKGNYIKMPVQMNNHSVYKLEDKITYVLYIGRSWVITGDLTERKTKFKNENANPNCPALSDTDSWEFWDDPAENDPRQRFELPQWKYIHQHVPNPQFTAKTTQLQDIAFSPDCYKTVHDAIIFKLFSERFFENESKTCAVFQYKMSRKDARDAKKLKKAISKLGSCRKSDKNLDELNRNSDAITECNFRETCKVLSELKKSICSEKKEKIEDLLATTFESDHWRRLKKCYFKQIKKKRKSSKDN